MAERLTHLQGINYMVFGREHASVLNAQEAVRKRYPNVKFSPVCAFDVAYNCYEVDAEGKEKDVYEIKYAR